MLRRTAGLMALCCLASSRLLTAALFEKPSGIRFVEAQPAAASSSSFALFPFDKDLSAFVLGYRENPQPSVAFDRFVALPIEEFEKSRSMSRS